MKKTASGVLTLIAVSAMIAQTADQKMLNVDDSKVDDDVKSKAKEIIDGDKNSHDLVFNNLTSLAEYVTQNQEQITVDKDALAAATYRYYHADDYDSVDTGIETMTYSNGKTPSIKVNCYSNCHRACHSACHGSRGWR
jgi:hypothetical protein